tara:strand:- start:174 stop:1097 length:924 start_codon:yes stop_codon:yes gene_type:complete
MGTPEWAIPSLKAIIDSGINISAVFTQPDRRLGRQKKLIPSPVKQYAEKNDIKVYNPEDASSRTNMKIVKSFKPEIILVCAYGQILSESFLKIPKIGCFNLHFSFLPKLRGASPVQTAIYSGISKTGVCLQKMNFRLDAGPIVASSTPINIELNDTSAILGNKLAKIGGRLLYLNLPNLLSNNFISIKQKEHEATYCKTIKKEDGHINWDKETAIEIERKSRAFEPWPGIFSFYCQNLNSVISRRIQIKQVEVVNGDLEPGKIYPEFIVGTKSKGLKILKLKPEGKNEMDSSSFLKGHTNIIGTFLR